MQDIDTTETITSPLAAACEAGTVRLYRLRSTGTRRLIPYLTGEAREVAEFLAHEVEVRRSVAIVAASAGMSRPTVRRALAALALVEEIEAGDHDDLFEDGVTEIEFGGDDSDE